MIEGEGQRRRAGAKSRRVASYLETYYALMEEYVGGGSGHAPVGGCWNPLQIMRNRRLRAAARESVREWIVKEDAPPAWMQLRLASRTFSRHPKPRNIWQVDLYEIAGDIRWREAHWGELRAPGGEQWFDTNGDPSAWLRAVESGDAEKEGTKGNSTCMPSAVAGDVAGEDANEDDVMRSANDQRSDLKRDSRLGSRVDVRADSKGWIKSEARTEAKTESRKFQSETTLSSEDNGMEESALSLPSVAHSTVQFESGDVDFLNLVRETSVCVWRGACQLATEEAVAQSQRDGLERLLEKQMSKYEALEHRYQGLTQRLTTIGENTESLLVARQDLNDRREGRIEELLGYCDRTSGDLNTSLALQIRMLGERAGALEGNTDARAAGRLASAAVEGLIIALLWSVWLVVEAWLIIRRAFSFALGVTVWLLL